MILFFFRVVLPGFKVKQLSELPRHLEAPELWDLVIKAQVF